jgi:hypothetical protein
MRGFAATLLSEKKWPFHVGFDTLTSLQNAEASGQGTFPPCLPIARRQATTIPGRRLPLFSTRVLSCPDPSSVSRDRRKLRTLAAVFENVLF